MLMLTQKAKSKQHPPFLHTLGWCLRGCHLRYVTYVTSVRPPAMHLAKQVVVSSKPTHHQTQPHPPDSHMGSWVGWVGEQKAPLPPNRFQLAQREGVFQSGKICGKS